MAIRDGITQKNEVLQVLHVEIGTEWKVICHTPTVRIYLDPLIGFVKHLIFSVV